MGKVLSLFVHELRILLKDRQALALLFVMPMTFIVFLTLALQDVYLAKVGRGTRLEIVAPGGCEAGSICASLVSEMRRSDWQIEVRVDWDRARRSPMAMILPADVSATVELLKSGTPLAAEDKIQLVFDPALDHALRALAEANFRLALQAVLIEQARQQIQDSDGSAPAVADAGRFAGLIEQRAWGGEVLPNPIQQTVPAWALFGMFFIVIPMANSMIRDRRLGVFKRLLSFPVTRGQLIAGKVLPFLLVNILQFALMFSLGVFLLPLLTRVPLTMDFGVLGIFVVTVVCALTATSYGLMVACLSRTPEQASAFGALSVVILAILGGVMIPRFVMPEFMQQVAMVSPLHWGLEAYHDLIVRRAGLAAAQGKLAVLLGFAMFFLLVSRLRFRWSEVY